MTDFIVFGVWDSSVVEDMTTVMEFFNVFFKTEKLVTKIQAS